MQDLNDKITGGSLTADQWNEVPSELQNVIEGLGLTLSAGDLNQLGKGIAGYMANGVFYVDSGAADAYVLTTIGSKQSPPAYTDGFEAVFRAGNSNTGATTVNVAGLGVKNVFYAGAALVGGEIISGRTVTIIYDNANGRFDLVPKSLGRFVDNSNGNPNIDDTFFDITTLVVGGWREIGPTGATNVWSPLNSIPSDVDWIEVKLLVDGKDLAGTANVSRGVTVYVRASGGAQGVGLDNVLGDVSYRNNSSGDGEASLSVVMRIPVVARKFEVNYASSVVTTLGLRLFLTGHGYN